MNERQRKVINRLWDGFEGKLTTQKYAKINHCSQDTALRDIQSLIEKHILRKTDEGGRSTNYELIAQKSISLQPSSHSSPLHKKSRPHC